MSRWFNVYPLKDSIQLCHLDPMLPVKRYKALLCTFEGKEIVNRENMNVYGLRNTFFSTSCPKGKLGIK